VMNGANQVGLRKIQLVIRPVDEHAFGVEESPHRAIAQNRRPLDALKNVIRHM
jgi:hypothetical protein